LLNHIHSDGKKDVNAPPKDIEAMYAETYQEGYDKGQNELKKSCMDQGYNATFYYAKLSRSQIKK
jgi:hypothetical protein